MIVTKVFSLLSETRLSLRVSQRTEVRIERTKTLLSTLTCIFLCLKPKSQVSLTPLLHTQCLQPGQPFGHFGFRFAHTPRLKRRKTARRATRARVLARPHRPVATRHPAHIRRISRIEFITLCAPPARPPPGGSRSAETRTAVDRDRHDVDDDGEVFCQSTFLVRA